MLTTKPESWDEFLEDIANDFAIKGKHKDVFLARFAYQHQCKPDEEIWQLAQSSSLESYKKQMTYIYSQFATSPHGCLNLNGAGAGKFEKLRIWLQEKYFDWLICFSSIPFNSYYIERSPYSKSDQMVYRTCSNFLY